MPDYRAYKRALDNSIKEALDAVCDDDKKAIAWAEQLAGGDDVEVWQGTRLVVRLPARPTKGVHP